MLATQNTRGNEESEGRGMRKRELITENGGLKNQELRMREG
jgi:hypothetical protein